MRENHLIGTTVPFTPPEIMPNEFAFHMGNIELMKNANFNIVRVYFTFPFKDRDMKELSDNYKMCVECVKLYAQTGIETMGMIANPGMMSADEKGTVSYVRQYPDWMGPVSEDYYFEVLEKSCEFVAKDNKDYC